MFFNKLIFLLYKNFLQLKIVQRYYEGLAVQTRFLYQQSELFKLRWQEMGLDFARESFEKSELDQQYFFWKAKQEPFRIRFQIFVDAITGKEPRPYYLSRNN